MNIYFVVRDIWSDGDVTAESIMNRNGIIISKHNEYNDGTWKVGDVLVRDPFEAHPDDLAWSVVKFFTIRGVSINGKKDFEGRMMPAAYAVAKVLYPDVPPTIKLVEAPEVKPEVKTYTFGHIEFVIIIIVVAIIAIGLFSL